MLAFGKNRAYALSMPNGTDLGPPGPGHTMERPPDPKTFDPVKDPLPPLTGIPEALEWKLDVIMVQLGRLNAGVNALVNLAVLILIPGLAGALAAIIALLVAINAALGAILAAIGFLTAIVIALAFLLGRRVVRRIDRLYL